MKQRKGWRMSCDVGKATEVLENELWRRWNDGKVGEWALQPFCHFTYVTAHSPTLILQPFRHFTYVTAHSPTLPSLYLRHSSFSNPSVASPTSQLILQPFFRFFYVTGFSLTLAGEPPMVVVPTKTRKKKSNNHGSGNAYFLSSVHLFIVATRPWLPPLKIFYTF